jgi:glucoamylase
MPMAGIVGSFASVQSVRSLGVDEAADAQYFGTSSVLRRSDGSLDAGPVSGVTPAAEAAAAARWLDAGLIPGVTPVEVSMAERALLDLRLLLRPGGAAVAAWHPYWRHVWPRDASWVAAALSVTGHRDDALSVLRFLQRVQSRDGTWEARYLLTGDGPVADGRAAQLDANGWVPWAVWTWYASGERGQAVPDRAALARLWPMVRTAADAAARSIGTGGLPPPGPDYWEARTDQVTLGTAAPLLTGLRSAAALASALGYDGDADRWRSSARQLDAGIASAFAPLGYPRAPEAGSGADAAVTFLAPPFAAATPEIQRAVRSTAARLRGPNGGVVPGEDWRHGRDTTWTPQTAFFALAAAASGDGPGADRWLRWLAAHRTSLGSLPEKVDRDGRPASVAPLGWTAAIVLLALTAKERPLPVPPAA